MVQPEGLIVVTTDTVPGRGIRQVLGMVWGIGVTNDHGNPSRQFKAADSARHEAYSNLEERARSMGANAVIGVATDSFVSRHESKVDREYTICGTAVVLD